MLDAIYQPLMELPIEQLPPVRATTVAPSERILALIPLFVDVHYPEEVIDAFVRAAIYSRWSCLQYTDAAAQGVSIKFYVEDVLYKRLTDVFDANHIDVEQDVLWFHAPPLPDRLGNGWARLSKKMCSYWDTRLAEYDWIVVWDADMSFRQDHHSLFETLHQEPAEELHYLRVDRFEWNWLRTFLEATEQGGISIEMLLERVGASHLTLTGKHAKPLGIMWCYPAKWFHTKLPTCVQWMQQHAPYIGDDEVCAMLLAHVFNFNIRSMQDRFNVTLKQGQDSGTLMHGKFYLPTLPSAQEEHS